MVFHIPTAHGLVWNGSAFEFTEDLFIGLPHDIRQYVEAASMRHSDHDFTHIIACRRLDDGIQCGNGRLPALQRKTLLPYVLGMQEFFEDDTLIEFVQDSFLL